MNPTAKQEPFELFMGCLGNGTTYCNKAVIDPETRDYKIIAHSNNYGVLDWWVNKWTLPADERGKIERDAERDHAKWLADWAAWHVEHQYQLLLEAMTIAELVDWRKHTDERREQRKRTGIPLKLESLVAEILRDGRCKNARKFYGLEAAR
jgi:hypothetical protein